MDLVRVEQPQFAGALTHSATGAVLDEPPPPGVPWRFESVPHVDAWTAEEAIESMRVGPWHALEADGTGVDIAIFDLQWFGAADPDELGEFTTHDCWADPMCEQPMDVFAPRFGFEEGRHGVACAEVLHDVAPGARLHLVRVNGQTTFENAVDWAIREDIDIVSMSMSFFNLSFYDGTGPVARSVEKLVSHGVLLVASAGNYAQRHWSGDLLDADGDRRADFAGDNGLTVWLGANNTRKTLYVAWNQHRSCGKTDLDVLLRDPEGRIAARGQRAQVAGADQCEPVERISLVPEIDGWYTLEVHHQRGAMTDLHLSVFAPNGTLEFPSPSGSVPDPGAHPWTLTVGAAPAGADYFTDRVESFSSWGPTSGGHAKPDLVGPDGLSTASFGYRRFYGTSAATPAVAGAIAVVQSSDPQLDAFAAADRVRAWAWTPHDAFERPDPRLGQGKVWLPMAVEPMGCMGSGSATLLFLPLLLARRRT